MKICRLPIPSDLTIYSLAWAIDKYCEWFEKNPFCLVFCDYVMAHKYGLLSRSDLRMLPLTIFNPFMPRDSWFIFGRDGIIYSPGA